MSVDREQVREYAEAYDADPRLGDFCLALLAELEQAEADRDEARRIAGHWSNKLAEAEKERDHLETELVRRQDENFLEEQISALESRLAKVPALVEALRNVLSGASPAIGERAWTHPQFAAEVRAALAEWERA